MDLDEDAQAVYRAMLADSTLGVDGLVGASGLSRSRVVRALDALVDLSLMHLDSADGGSMNPTPPRVALARFMATAEAELLSRQQRLASLRAMLESIAVEHEASLDRESLVRHASRTQTRARLAELALAATKECLSFNPGRSHDAAAMHASKPVNAEALARGVGIRALYQDSCRTDPATRGYAQWLTESGGEVRTAPSVPMLMVIVDGEVALLPWAVGEPEAGALEVRVPAIVAALVEHFELAWATADPLGQARHRDVAVHGAMGQALVRLAAAGVTDEAAARKLELSTRTVRRMMAEIMTELGASSRFQAGVEAARRGWLD